jgi:phosphopantothenoylcysteine decarboxylase/phosphopantothenate--cysteine ligase
MESSDNRDRGRSNPKQRIALGVSGGIACYKAAEILRRLQDHGFDVVVIMTPSAAQFVTPLTFAALSGHRVYTRMFEGTEVGSSFDGPFDHIFLAESIDLFLVAPATANCIARMASGTAEDFLTTFHLAVKAPVVVAPAMNTRMWEHPSVGDNLRRLEDRGVRIIPPAVGRMACETHGPGRLAEVGHIVDYVVSLVSRTRDLEGRRVLVTAGPTVEDIDPVRFISNRSSGKMGYAIAQAVADRGGSPVLVSGPSSLRYPGVIRVRTTEQMRQAVLDHLDDVEVVIKAAAPLDFRPTGKADQKIKKTSGLEIGFEPAPDILAEIGRRKNGKVLVGFAAETRNHIEAGFEKLRSKNLDLIVVNPVDGPDSAFDSDTNRVSILDAEGNCEELPTMSKGDLAHRIIDRIIPLLEEPA